MLPSFLCIGAQRAGTTWLHNCLAAHPQICMPLRKETHFFYTHFDKGLEWYESQFAHCETDRVAGEVCPNYLYHPEAIRRIRDNLPNVKLLAILRNPIDRAYSAYQLFRRERFPDCTFREALERDRRLTDMGMYARHLEKVYEIFPPEQVRLFLYEDLQSRPAQLLRSIYGYLGVREDFLPEAMSKRYNRVLFPRTQAVIYALGMGRLIEWFRATPIGERVRDAAGGVRRPNQAMSMEDRAWLAELFHDDVARLEQIMERDLRHWLDVP